MAVTRVVYFSASGVTARVAHAIAEAVGTKAEEIAPEHPYTAQDLDWGNRQSRSSREMADDAARPALARSMSVDVADADKLFVGFPIWWYREPSIVDTFMDEAAPALAARHAAVIPFATSGGSGISGAEQHLRKLYPDVDWRPGALLNGVDAAAWAREAR